MICAHPQLGNVSRCDGKSSIFLRMTLGIGGLLWLSVRSSTETQTISRNELTSVISNSARVVRCPLSGIARDQSESCIQLWSQELSGACRCFLEFVKPSVGTKNLFVLYQNKINLINWANFFN